MPVRTRAKAAARGRPQRLPTQFGELETTPTSRHHGELDPPPAISGGTHDVAAPDLEDQPTRLVAHGDVFDDELEDEDLAGLEKSQSIIPQMPRRTSIQWSETESLARRSSPLSPEEAPLAEWQFDEDDSLPPLSTPKSDRDQLPDTVPLADASPVVDEGGALTAASKKVDFSETASTIRRSSPVGNESMHHVFDLLDDSTSISPSNGKHSVSLHGPTHLPPDDIYDVTPPPSTSQETLEPQPKANAARRREAHPPVQGQPAQHVNKQTQRKSTKAQSRTANTKRYVKQARELDDKEPELPNPSRINQMGSGVALADADASQLDKGKKRKQRPKSPLQFDETSRVKEAQSRPSTHGTQKLRMPVVTALRESAQPSSSPSAVPRKRGAANNKQPRAKKAKTTSVTTQIRKKQSATKHSILRNQKPAATEQPTLRDRASPSPEAAVTTPKPIVIFSEDDGNFPQPPAIDTAFDSGDEPMVPVEVAALSPPRVKDGELCASASSSHYLHKAIADAEFSECVKASGTGAFVERDSRKLLDSRNRNDDSGQVVGAEKQVTGPVSFRGRSPERLESHRDRQQGRTARRTSRNYSISVHGSPLPANHNEDYHGSSIVAEPAKSIKDRPPPKFLDTSQLKAVADDVSSWRAEWLQSGRCVDKEARRSGQQRDMMTEPLQGVGRDVRAEILASLREHDALQEEQVRRCRHGTEQGCDKDKSPQVDERDSLPDNLSKQLHQVVNTMLQHLRSKEEAGRKVVETYRKKTSGCIEKIRHRQKQERRVLAEAMLVDGEKFRKVIGKARSVVARGSQSRARDMRELEQKTAERQAAYDRAMTSLRGLQRQLLQGSDDSGKQGKETAMLELKLL